MPTASIPRYLQPLFLRGKSTPEKIGTSLATEPPFKKRILGKRTGVHCLIEDDPRDLAQGGQRRLQRLLPGRRLGLKTRLSVELIVRYDIAQSITIMLYHIISCYIIL